MTQTHPQLPPPSELADWIRDQRYRLDLSQSELAERVGISPSQLSRIENQSGRAAYKTLYDIQQELQTAGDPAPTHVIEYLSEKHDTRSEKYRLAFVGPEDRLDQASATMHSLDVSQLPVLAADGSNKGRITAQDLLSTETDPEDPVASVMRQSFPEVPADAPASTVRMHLRTNEAVLVTAGDTDLSSVGDTRFVGILTPADFTGR